LPANGETCVRTSRAEPPQGGQRGTTHQDAADSGWHPKKGRPPRQPQEGRPAETESWIQRNETRGEVEVSRRACRIPAMNTGIWIRKPSRLFSGVQGVQRPRRDREPAYAGRAPRHRWARVDKASIPAAGRAGWRLTCSCSRSATAVKGRSRILTRRPARAMIATPTWPAIGGQPAELNRRARLSARQPGTRKSPRRASPRAVDLHGQRRYSSGPE